MATSHTAQVVVITGARAGVRRATVRAFARRGAQIGLLARGRDELEVVRKEVEAAGGKALVLPTNVADADQVEAAAAAVEETFGPIDLWINNAMVTVFSPVKEMQPAEYLRVTAARSFRSARRSPTAASRSSQPTVAQRPRFAVSRIPCAPS